MSQEEYHVKLYNESFQQAIQRDLTKWKETVKDENTGPMFKAYAAANGV